MNEQAIAVANHLKSLPDITKVRPCLVTIGKTIYVGAKYTSIGRYQAEMQAVTDWRKQVGDQYESDRLYLLMDKLPPSYSRRPKPVYVIEGKECYVGGYFDQNEKNDQHPFGKVFFLHAWDVSGEKIDQHESKPRKRMQVTVEYLDAANESCQQPLPSVGMVTDVSPTAEVPHKASA